MKNMSHDLVKNGTLNILNHLRKKGYNVSKWRKWYFDTFNFEQMLMYKRKKYTKSQYLKWFDNLKKCNKELMKLLFYTNEKHTPPISRE